MFVQVDAGGADAAAGADGGIPGVDRASPRPSSAASSGAFEVESERGTDIRREIARTIVNRGWGLLELRPMRMSLEEVFLQVTTEERPETSGGEGLERARRRTPGTSTDQEGSPHE